MDTSCPYCEFVGKNITSIGTHVAMKHNVSGEQLYLLKNGLSEPPLCECGCGEHTRYISLLTGYNKLVKGHVSQRLKEERGKKIAQAFKENPQSRSFTSTQEYRDKISNRKKELFASGELHNWSDKRFNPDVVMWNTGLTKDSDERIRELSKKTSTTLKNLYQSGELKIWCTGLTKESDVRLKEIGEKISTSYCNGETQNWWHDPTRKQEIGQRIADSKRLPTDEVSTRFESNQFEFLGDVGDYRNNVTKFPFKCNDCGYEQFMTLHAFERGMLCIGCQNSKVSKAQLEIYEFINSRVPARLADREAIGPLELDVYVPGKRFAVEYNGLYYHSEAFRKVDPKAHSRKQKLCQDSGISLFQVFEDEWLKKKEIIESMILHRLGLSESKIHGRNCVIGLSTPSKEINKFLESSHLEGVGGRYNVAFTLHNGEELVAALTLRKPLSKIHSGLIEVARFAVKKNTTIPGGMSRLVAKASQWAKENEFTGLMTYLDQRLGAVMTYESCGFKFIKETPPRFWWASLKEMKRYPRQKFKATSNLTEGEVALKENVCKIYGCKNSFFMLKFT